MMLHVLHVVRARKFLLSLVQAVKFSVRNVTKKESLEEIIIRFSSFLFFFNGYARMYVLECRNSYKYFSN